MSEQRQTVCLSACALAFLGGLRRHIWENSVYGVHQFSFGKALAEAAGAVDVTQRLSGMVVSYIAEMGADPALFSMMTRKGPNDITILDRAKLETYRIVTVASVKWSFEMTDGQAYLKVERDDDALHSKIIFACGQGTTLLAIGLIGWNNAKDIAQIARQPIYLIDGKIKLGGKGSARNPREHNQSSVNNSYAVD